jgi:hypothetical protein
MAKVQFINAIVSGKLAGSVYSRGKGGAYIRSFRKPTQPNSQSQLTARANFGASSRAWNSLSSAEKNSWNSFAALGFSPKNPKTGVSYSGFNAFKSFFNTILALSPGCSTTGVDGTPTTPVALTFAPFVVGIPQGTSIFSGQISNDTGAYSATTELVSTEIDVSGSPSIRLDFSCANSGIDVSGWAGFKFFDLGSQEEFGYMVQISKKTYTAPGSSAQKQKLLIGGLTPITNTLDFTDGTPMTGFHLKFDMSGFSSNSKYAPQAGDAVTVTVYAVSASGASAIIGSNDITII